MTKRQRVEHKFGNVARELDAARRRHKGMIGFLHTTSAKGIIPRYKRAKARLLYG